MMERNVRSIRRLNAHFHTMSDQTTKAEPPPTTAAPAPKATPKTLAVQIAESKDSAQALLAAASVQDELAKIAIADQDVKRICNQLLRQCMRQPEEFVEVMRTIYLRGGGFAELLPQLGAVLVFALVFNLWAVKSYKKSS